MRLEWWNPTVGYSPISQNNDTTWIRDLGIPLHLWSQKIFSEVWNLCGRWVFPLKRKQNSKTPEVARIQTIGDGRSFPSEVTIEIDDFKFHIPI